jgi:hypothetical protein
MSEVQISIIRYQMPYRGEINVANRRENDKHVFNIKKRTKAVWQVINSGLG